MGVLILIKIIVADDQTLFRTMLEEMLKLDKEIEIVASASNGFEATQFAIEYMPDIVLLDIQMPEMTGIEALKEIKKSLPKTKVVMLTTFENVDTIMDSCNAGADGSLVKDMKPDILIMAIKCIYNDIVLINSAAYSVLFSSKNTIVKSKDKYEFGNVCFDYVDIMIMRQIVEGRTNKEIAQVLNYSEGTIKNRVSRILSTTGLSDRTQISVFALKNNII